MSDHGWGRPAGPSDITPGTVETAGTAPGWGDQDAWSVPQSPQQPEPPRTRRRTGRKRGSKSTVVAVVAVAVVVVLALVVGVVAYLLVLRPAWGGGEGELAARYPEVVSDRENGDGWRGLSCEGRDPGNGQEARIVCADGSLSLVVAEFVDEETRETQVPSEGRETLSNGDCTVQTVDVPGNENPTYAMIPVDGGADALLLSGQGAADLITLVPVC
ncbi:hypothetical protein [Corynebacterium glyciniphilum]|uniref:hypothetical protein n=1 Tax=Corynebacterium glyciniphilum TaxID=1404244 RepID=UPI003FD3BA76